MTQGLGENWLDHRKGSSEHLGSFQVRTGKRAAPAGGIGKIFRIGRFAAHVPVPL
jgi:hypothetical protein